MDVVPLGDITLGRGVFEPVWRWSNDVKPIAGTDPCQVHHTGLCLSGQMTVKPDDGEEITIGPGVRHAQLTQTTSLKGRRGRDEVLLTGSAGFIGTVDRRTARGGR